MRKTYGYSEGKLFEEAKGLRCARNHLVQSLLLKSHQGQECTKDRSATGSVNGAENEHRKQDGEETMLEK